MEQAVCRAWNEQGVIPDEDLKNIMQDVDFDVDKILEIESVTRHDIIAFLTYLEQRSALRALQSIWAAPLPTSWTPPWPSRW